MLALVPLALYAVPAAAADLDYIPPIIGSDGLRGTIQPAPVDWNGFYIGATAGGAFAGRFGASRPGLTVPGIGTTTAPLHGSADTNGFIGGATMGLQYEAEPVVVGIEGDISGTSLDGGVSEALPGGSTVQAKARLQYFGTIRARIGYAFDRVMVYATGGVAFGGIKCTLAGTAGAFSGTSSATKFQAGYAVGGGVEFRLSPAWSVKAEYLFADLGKKTYRVNLGGGASAQADLSFRTQIVRAGLNYWF
jgi:outer membrane immunogenic protein